MSRIPSDLLEGIRRNRHRLVLVLGWMLEDHYVAQGAFRGEAGKRALRRAFELLGTIADELGKIDVLRIGDRSVGGYVADPPLRTVGAVLMRLEQLHLAKGLELTADGWWVASLAGCSEAA